MCLKFFQKLLGISVDVEEDSDFELVYLHRKKHPSPRRMFTEAEIKDLEG
jgi:hypothetical protein